MISIPHILPGGPQSMVVQVTPAIAADWLELNTCNRTLRPKYVSVLARQMAAGNWQFNGGTISFSREGLLLDGQHRLSAVVESGVTIVVLVVTELNAESQDTMDSGAKRTASDVLALNGLSRHSVLTAAIVRRVLAYRGGELHLSNNRPVSNTDILAFSRDNEASTTLAAYMASHVYSTFRGAPASVIGTAVYLTAEIHRDDSDRFFRQVASGADLPNGHPVLTLRTTLTNARDRRERVQEGRTLHMIFRAWNAVRDGKSLGAIVLKPGQIITPQ